jgi:hypothetical protein
MEKGSRQLQAAENYFTIQSMKTAWWFAAILGPLFLGWAHVHTDEIPVVLGFVLIVSAVLGALEPSRFLVSWAVAGAPLFVAETLVHFGMIGAPYPPSAGLPFVALVAYVPAAIGVAAGAGVRRMTGKAAVS